MLLPRPEVITGFSNVHFQHTENKRGKVRRREIGRNSQSKQTENRTVHGKGSLSVFWGGAGVAAGKHFTGRF